MNEAVRHRQLTRTNHAPSGADVELRDVTHRYNTEAGPLTVLDRITLLIPAGAYLAVTGPSGAGKSTLLSLLGGLERPQHGTVRVGEHNLHTLRGNGLAEYRRSTLGFVFQHFGLLDTLSAFENVELAGTLAGRSRRARRDRAAELLEAVGLSARMRHRPLQLSGGERQRVAIARALANDPQLLLADEPTGNLDGEATTAVIELLERIHRERRCTLVVVTHNPAVADRARYQLHLSGGRVAGARRRADPQPSRMNSSVPTRASKVVPT